MCTGICIDREFEGRRHRITARDGIGDEAGHAIPLPLPFACTAPGGLIPRVPDSSLRRLVRSWTQERLLDLVSAPPISAP